jgi:hypothetical protein
MKTGSHYVYILSLLHNSRGAGGTAPSLAKRRPALRGFGRVKCHPDRLKAGVLQEALL